MDSSLQDESVLDLQLKEKRGMVMVGVVRSKNNCKTRLGESRGESRGETNKRINTATIKWSNRQK